MRISPAMFLVLDNLSNGRDATSGLYGRSSWGGHGQVIDALRRRLLIEHGDSAYHLTDAGRDALAKHYGEAP